MHIPLNSNALSSLQQTGAAAMAKSKSGSADALFSANLTDGQDLQGDAAAAAGLPTSSGGGLLAPSSLNLLIAQQADESDPSPLATSTYGPSGASDPSSGANSSSGDLRRKAQLS